MSAGRAQSDVREPWCRAAGILAPVALLAALAGGCRPSVSWTIRFDPESLASRAVLVRAEIREGGCSGPARYSSELSRGERVAPVPPVLGSGRWGFAAAAIDDGCVRFASVCEEVSFPGPSVVALVLVPTAEASFCGAGVCAAGVCAGPDAGTMPDAGERLDAAIDDVGLDAPARDANWSDAGPLDLGPQLLPYLPCGSTLESGMDPYLTITGSVTRMGLVHRDGLCTDCTDEVMRLASGANIEGHLAFASTFELLVARQAGAGTLSIEVCGAPFSSASLLGAGTAGFETMPYTPTPVTTSGECPFRISASGGPVSIRRFDLGCRTATAAPVVDVQIDGMDGIVTQPAPASVMLTWSATEANACVGMGGTWSGPQPLTGAIPLLHLSPGDFTFRLDCTNGVGTGTDSGTLQVIP